MEKINKFLLEVQKKFETKVVIIATFHWLLTFLTDRLIFSDVNKKNFIIFLFSKVIFWFLLLNIWSAVFEMIVKSEKGNRYRNIIKTSLPYFLLLFSFIICIWPTNIAWGDMISIFNNTTRYNIVWKYHYFTSLFHIISFMFIPIITAPTILLAIVWALFYGWLQIRLNMIFGKRAKYIIILFILLPTLFYSLYPNRVPMYAMMYLFFYALLYLDYISEAKNNIYKIFLRILFAAILISWRSESIYLIIFVPLFLCITYYHKLIIKKIFCYIFSIILVLILINTPQKIGEKSTYIDYGKIQKENILAYTITTMFYENLDEEKNNDLLKKIDQVLDIDMVKRVIKDYGIHCYKEAYTGLSETEYYAYKEAASKEQYSEFNRSCIKLFLNNPIIFMKAKLKAFHYCAINKRPFADNISMKTISENYNTSKLQSIIADTPYPFMKSLYNSIISGGGSYLPSLEKTSLFMKGITLVKKITYNLYIPLILLIVMLLYAIQQHNKMLVLIAISFIIHLGIVILGAYAGYFMYYLPLYYTIYFLIISIFIIGKNTKKNK